MSVDLARPVDEVQRAHAAHLDHIDGGLDGHTQGCTKCRLSRDGSMCHTGHTLYLAAKAART